MSGRFLVLLLGLMFCFNSLSTFAQAKEKKAQSYVVMEFVVKPGKIADFEAAYKESVDECKKQNYYLPIYVYRMEFPHYYAFYPPRPLLYTRRKMATLKELKIKESWIDWDSLYNVMITQLCMELKPKEEKK